MDIKTPFELINYLGKKEYKDISNIDKKRNFFIVNRMLSRAMPDIATNLGHLSSVPETSLDYWNIAFIDLYKTPKGKNILSYIKKVLYVSMAGAKKKQAVKIDKELAIKYMELTKISKKEFDIMVYFFETEVIKYLKEVEKMLKTTK